MEDLATVTAKNIAALRTASHMTQSELGEKLSYSDKAISKWERGEAVPDAYVLKDMSLLFGVTVDYILSPHAEKRVPLGTARHNRLIVALLSFFGVWALAFAVYVLLSTFTEPDWRFFIYVVPVSFLVLLVFNAVWGKRLGNFLLSGALVASLPTVVYFALLPQKNWLLFVLIAPAELLVFLAYRLKKDK